MISPNDLQALLLTLKLATVSTGVLLVLGLPLAWWLAHTRHWSKSIIETTIALPLVLPPTVIGFYLLIAFSPEFFFAQSWQNLFSSRLAFSFEGLVIGSIIYSLPFVVQPLQNCFEKIPAGLMLAAATLGASPVDRFFSLVIPLSKRALLAAATLAFAHTVGEFGIVLMIGGNIPGETQVVSIALYDHVESLNYAGAHQLSLILLGLSFFCLLLLYSGGSRRFFRLMTPDHA